ncbi:MAG: hypothetical protein N2D54_08845 [Chloroflexota bacterium]
MAPVVHGLEDKYGDQVRFVYLDIDDSNNKAFMEAVGYDRRWRPYIMIVDRDGNVILDSSGGNSIWVGVIPGEILELGILNALGY